MVVLFRCWVLFVLWVKLHYNFQGVRLKTSLDNNKKAVLKWVTVKHFSLEDMGGWRMRKRLKMRTGWAIFMSKLCNNSAPKMILGKCWGARAWSLAIPWQACCQLLKTETADNHRFIKWANSLLLPCAFKLIFAKQKEQSSASLLST